MDGPVVERQLRLPASPARLWEALTEPEEVAAWFGQRVEWDVTPGGTARWFAPDDATPPRPDPAAGEEFCSREKAQNLPATREQIAREGVVDEVEPGRRLSFRWWPSEGDGSASSVTYQIEPDGDGSRLTVREAPAASASATVTPTPTAAAGGERWTAWDTRGFHLWAQAAATAGARA